MSSNPIQAACTHTTMSHMFYNVLCPNQSLITRMTTAALGGMLLVGVVFAAYSTFSKYFLTPSSPKIPEYPEIGKQAIESTLASLKEHPDVSTTRNFQMQPIDTRIPHIANFHWTVNFEAFEEALKRHQDSSPWEQDEVIQAADALMKSAYTVSCLTLEDLKPFLDKHNKKDANGKNTWHDNQTMTSVAALTMQCSYQYRTFYYCTDAYHWIRGAIIWNENAYQGAGIEHTNDLVPETHAQPFYKEGTIQNSWNQLYNDYCDRVRSYVKEEDLRKPNWKGGDQRHANWTRKDTEIKTFGRVPDTQPT